MAYSIHWNYADTPGPDPCVRDVDCPLPLTANMWRVGGDIRPNWGSVLRLVDINTGKSGKYTRITSNPPLHELVVHADLIGMLNSSCMLSVL